MQNMIETRDEIKAACISNSAKLLAGYMAATGKTNAKTISEALGIPLRTVQRLKLEVATANANSANDATRGASENANSATDGASEAPKAPPVASPARVEEKLLPLQQEETSQAKLRKPKPAAKCKRGARLPDDWVLPKTWGDWVLTNCPTSNPESIRVEALKFANHWQAKTGQNATKVDWYKTWQNWALTAFSRAPVRNGYAPARTTDDTVINIKALRHSSGSRPALPAPGSVMMEAGNA